MSSPRYQGHRAVDNMFPTAFLLTVQFQPPHLTVSKATCPHWERMWEEAQGEQAVFKYTDCIFRGSYGLLQI